ncbi:MAG: peptide chain release factor N(5)-glutamine methyltransferase [Chloroflexi bacterium]|nr:peptide chain release factor N(5)-glutamine methyltransferase [Chloroflexota bacterium]
MKARAVAARVRAELEAAGIPDAALEAEVLTRHASGLSRGAFFADEPVPEGSCAELDALVARRLRREPAPYLTGIREFHGLEFLVGPGTLIPRPETELLVEIGVAELARCPDATVLDVGTGCGAIAIAVASGSPGANVIAADVSVDALRIAALNIERHDAAVSLVQSDLASSVTAADIVLANLPYVPEGDIEGLQPEVRQWEPRVALDGGADGLDLVRALLADCGSRLRPRLAAFEVGMGQAGRVAEEAERLGASASIEHDLAGWERVVTARWE